MNNGKGCRDSSGPLNGCWWPTHCVIHACMVCVCVCVCVCVYACIAWMHVWMHVHACGWTMCVDACLCLDGWSWLQHTLPLQPNLVQYIVCINYVYRQCTICTDNRVLR